MNNSLHFDTLHGLDLAGGAEDLIIIQDCVRNIVQVRTFSQLSKCLGYIGFEVEDSVDCQLGIIEDTLLSLWYEDLALAAGEM